jgi:hypothetical protein
MLHMLLCILVIVGVRVTIPSLRLFIVTLPFGISRMKTIHYMLTRQGITWNWILNILQ